MKVGIRNRLHGYRDRSTTRSVYWQSRSSISRASNKDINYEKLIKALIFPLRHAREVGYLAIVYFRKLNDLLWKASDTSLTVQLMGYIVGIVHLKRSQEHDCLKHWHCHLIKDCNLTCRRLIGRCDVQRLQMVAILTRPCVIP